MAGPVNLTSIRLAHGSQADFREKKQGLLGAVLTHRHSHHSIGQSNRQGEPSLKEEGNKLHLLRKKSYEVLVQGPWVEGGVDHRSPYCNPCGTSAEAAFPTFFFLYFKFMWVPSHFRHRKS